MHQSAGSCLSGSQHENPYRASKESNLDLMGRQTVFPGSFTRYPRRGRQQVSPFHIKERRGEAGLVAYHRLVDTELYMVRV